MSTRLTELNETQILEQIRKHFEGESLEGIDTDNLVDSSATLEELMIKIRSAIDVRNAGSSGDGDSATS